MFSRTFLIALDASDPRLDSERLLPKQSWEWIRRREGMQAGHVGRKRLASEV